MSSEWKDRDDARERRDPPQIDDGPAGEEDPGVVAGTMGGATAAAAGGALGSLLGPAGVLVGGLAGAAGGWWAGRGVAEAAGDFDDETDEYYRSLHRHRHADRCDYQQARSFYKLGHVARQHPQYRGRDFGEVEPELKRGWRGARVGAFRSWDEVRPFVSCGYREAPPGR